MKKVFVVAIGAALSAGGCSSSSQGTGSDDSTPKAGGEYIKIEECETPDGDSLRITNRGLYVRCERGETSTVHRLSLGGPSPSWYAHKPGYRLLGFEPTKRDTEQPDEFNIFWFNVKAHGFTGVGSDTPATETAHPTMVAHVERMVVDHSSRGNKWVFTKGGAGWEILRVSSTSAGGTATFETIIKAPAPGGEYVEADESDAIVWAGLGSKLSKIGIDKTVKTVDLPTKPISKIRVKSGYVWVQAGSSVYRISRDTSDVKSFATIGGENESLGGGGSFAVDGNFVYLTDGRKINIDSGQESEFFSTTINPSAAVSVDSIMMQTEFKASLNLEVSSDPLDGYVYMVSTSKGARILRVTK